MARTLHYRVVEAQVRACTGGYQVVAWLLIKGQGTSIHFVIDKVADLPARLELECAAAYQKVTGSPLP